MPSDISTLLDTTDATGIAEEVRRGAVHPRELVAEAISRIEARDGHLNALVGTCFDEALDTAGSVDRALPFAGVPFVVKDLGAQVAGLAHTRGSRLWADDVAAEDSELVARYRRAGFIVLGTTNAPELGRNASTEPLLHGPTRNPHGLGHSPGGSSGGTAAAIAAGMVPIGHGNDGGGSIRIPSSACGLVGLKPSRGRTPAAPFRSMLSYPMNVNHVLTRSVRDTALVLDLTAGPSPGDPYEIATPSAPWTEAVRRDTGPLRVGVCHARGDDRSHPDCVAATEATARLLESLGHEITRASPEFPIDALNEVMRTLMGVPLAVQINRRLAELDRPLRDDDLEPFTRMMYDAAGATSGEEVLIAMELVEEIARTLGGFFVDHDLLLTPTYPRPTPELGVLDTTDIDAMITHAGTYASLTSPFNTTGQPAISLPLATDTDGRPLGVQLVAAYGREDLLISVAGTVEAATPWDITPTWPPVQTGSSLAFSKPR